MEYEWDDDKASSNLHKHGVDFADAVGVFYDDLALSQEDAREYGEQRFVVIGEDFTGCSVTVVYTYRGDDIRIISARQATKKERQLYEQGRKN